MSQRRLEAEILSVMRQAGMTSRILGGFSQEHEGRTFHFFRGRAKPGVAVRCLVIVSPEGVEGPRIISRGELRSLVGRFSR